MRISEFKPGEHVRLVGFGQTDPAYRRKLLSLGITRGVELLIVRLAPLGCPVHVELRGTALALRKDEAKELDWERV